MINWSRNGIITIKQNLLQENFGTDNLSKGREIEAETESEREYAGELNKAKFKDADWYVKRDQS